MAICQQQCRGRRRKTAPSRSPCRRNGRVIFAFLGLVLCAAGLPSPADLQLDWGEWEKQEAPGDEADVASTSPCVGGCHRPFPQAGAELRRLVRECASGLALPGNPCKDKDEPVLEDDYRVPLMKSGSVGCGFEKRPAKEEMEELASRYTFHLIGDSTSRRLGESFVSIFTGKGSTHPVAQQNRNFSAGNLKVLFYWAPHCSGPQGIRAVLKTVLDAVDAAKDDGKRAVILTAFGVHDAFELHHSANGHGSAAYESELPQDIVEKDGMRSAALSACRDTTVELISRAATGAAPRRAEEVQPPEGDRGRKLASLQQHVQADDRHASDICGDSVAAVGEDGANEVPAPSSPLFFLMQNNRYPPGSVEDMFLEDLHRIQRQEVEGWERGCGADRGLFLVNDSVSLYGNLSCYRNANPIHFYEPVKLVEGKMLWDLLALVDG